MQEIIQAGKDDTGYNREVWSGVKWSSLYLIWSNQDKLVFKGEKRKLVDLVVEFQRKVYEWMKGRDNKLEQEWASWVNNPIEL